LKARKTEKETMEIPGLAGNLIYKSLTGGTVNLAVTGLSRAGKTVFITSLLANILAAGAQGRTEKAKHKMYGFDLVKSDRLKSARVLRAGSQKHPRFNFEANAHAMASASPTWPGRSAAVAEIGIELEFWQRAGGGDYPNRTAKINLNILDYPGEWLVDIPMLGQTFAQWSDHSIDLARRGLRSALSEKWHSWLKSQNFLGPENEAEARQGAEFWQEYLCECRLARLPFLQPAHFIRQAHDPDEFSRPILDRPAMWFFPIEKPSEKIKDGSQYKVIEDRYNAYRKEFVAKFFNETFTKFTRQVILVDVLGALNAGQEAFHDTKLALTAVNNALTSQNDDWLARMRDFRIGRKTERILFAATKADHVPALQQDALKQLLLGLIYDSEGSFTKNVKNSEAMALASVVCTEETSVRRDGRTENAITGLCMASQKRKTVFMPFIPTKPPNDAWWKRNTTEDGKAFEFPFFQPPKLDDWEYDGIPNLNVDEALQYLVGDKCQ
jgi:predicted YcjX-like family ATPase